MNISVTECSNCFKERAEEKSASSASSLHRTHCAFSYFTILLHPPPRRCIQLLGIDSAPSPPTPANTSADRSRQRRRRPRSCGLTRTPCRASRLFTPCLFTPVGLHMPHVSRAYTMGPRLLGRGSMARVRLGRARATRLLPVGRKARREASYDTCESRACPACPAH